MVEKTILATVDVYDDKRQLVKIIDFDMLSACAEYINSLPATWDIEIHFHNPMVH